MRDAQIIHTLNYLQPQKMEDDLKNGRRPQKWKTTSKMEDDIKNGRQPQNGR